MPGNQEEQLHCQAQLHRLWSGTQRFCGALHTAGMWPWMDTQYLGRTGGEELGVLCFTLRSSLTNAVPRYQAGGRPAESFWVKITARSNLGDVVVDEDYRLQTRRRQGLKTPIWSPSLGNQPHLGFQPPVVCWNGSTTLGRQPRMFLECNYNIFLAQEQGSHD